ncbi:hypothetical protein V7S43_000767 [Phytophthora oleae]|uniref:ZZ-type domain-containing protein n=1 Tax=Phytophthora oleae TaxID=2107226 RepID=A0ABD3G832_9STRA
MEATRQAIRQGRLLADAGLDEHAMDTWKEALSGAYSSQDYAGMFVLSGNIGEACMRIAKRSKASSPKVSGLLQEAKEHLDYALQIVEQCNLREVLGGYKAVYQGVRRVEILKRKAEKLADNWEKEAVACTTCGRVGKEVVLDENDGCYYCRECYDEYYAAAMKTKENTSVAVAVGDFASAEEKADTDDEAMDEFWTSDQGNGNTEFVASLVDEAVDAVIESDPVEVVVSSSDPSDEPARKIEETAEYVHKETEAVVKAERQEELVEVTQNCTRYERVELGSLADFLEGKPLAENKSEQFELLQRDDSKDTLVAVDKGPAESKDSIEEIIGPQDNSTTPQTSDEVAPCVEKTLVLDEAATALNEAEDTADTANKFVYSIVHLLELRKSSPKDCPETLLTSPVRDDGTAATFVRTKTSNTKKKSNAKKTARSAKAERLQPAAPEKTETPFISPLPTLELCNAMRKILQEYEESSLATGTTAALSAVLFGSSSADAANVAR